MEIPGEHSSPEYKCSACNQMIDEEAQFCNHCGALQPEYDLDDAIQKQNKIITLSVFFGVYLIVCLVSNFARFARGLTPLMIFDGALSIFTIVYVVLYRQDLKNFFRWKSFTFIKITFYASTAILSAIIVNFLVRWLNKTIFDSDSYYYYAFSHLKYAKLVTVLVVALQPAIFEELAFRGVMQTGLNKVTDARQSIFISAFLFSLLHMSFISFIWLMPFALWLGYVREKEKTIWYGVVIHFCFNTTACFLEFFELNLF